MARSKPTVQIPEGEPPAELTIEEIKEGTGEELMPGRTADIHYVGVAWSTRKQFDASWDRGQPLTAPIGRGQLIQGWDQGLLGMKVGGRRKLTIPPQLGYGDTGAGGVIAGGETLVFICDLVALH